MTLKKRLHTTAFVFPGQGSQVVGMGRDLAEHERVARAAFDEADSILDFPLSRLCFEGPEAELNDTYNTQPALFVTSIAALRVLAARGIGLPAFAAGHSLGEFSALTAAGALAFADGVRLVRERGRLMKLAGERNPGGMAAILGLDRAVLDEVCAEATALTKRPIQVANDNCPGQLVISGDRNALEAALELAKARGAKRALPLTVSIAAHSALMATVAQDFKQVVEDTPFSDPQVPIIGNVGAQPLTDIDAIRADLSAQLTAPVAWTDSVRAMLAQGVTTFVEVGPKDVLTGLLKRIDANARGLKAGDRAGVEEVVHVLA
jgi:[acyl-carrier-protein] S-malonyltransferase